MTGHRAWRTSAAAVLPITKRDIPLRPWVVATTIVAPIEEAKSETSSATS